MSISAKLHVEDKEYNIINLKIKIEKKVNRQGLPISDFTGGYFDIEIETTKDNKVIDWMLAHSGLKDARIEIPSRFGTSSSRIIDLKDVFCVQHEDTFKSSTNKSMTTKFRLSPGGVYNNGEVGFIKYWHEPKPEIKKEEKKEKEEKKVTLLFEASNRDVRSGKFGYDKLPDNYKKICKSDVTALENEYKPLQVYGEKYFPVWVSMRKGQTITLKIDATKRKNFKLFENIKFSPNPDFTFEPANLKDVSEVRITCNNTNETPTQIKVEGDGEVVGAVNFFYPEPKTVKLDWRYVEITGNNEDASELKRQIKSLTLKDLLDKAFRPMLIDISLENENPNIIDLTSKKEFLEKSNILVNGTSNYIKSELKKQFTGNLQQISSPSKTCITLYLVNRNCLDAKNAIKAEEDGIDSIGGFSPINSGYAYGIMVLNKMLPFAIAHEIMHAIGLDHTFDNGKHKFDPKTTRNYMDYSDSKDYTYKWQWEIAREHSLLK
jgi:Hemolysin coregulated protein Hcp (TssD)